MFSKSIFLTLFCAGGIVLNGADDFRNLLINPDFSFHAFHNHRQGKSQNFYADYVPGWNASGAQALRVFRDSHIAPQILPPTPVPNGVKLNPGEKFSQFFTLPEVNLIPGDRVSFEGYIYQYAPNAVQVTLQLMKLDSEDGEWSPSKEFGFRDKRTFARHARGELVAINIHRASSAKAGLHKLQINNFEIHGHFTPGRQSHSKDINAIGLKLEYSNTSKNPVWIYPPNLVRGAKARPAVGTLRPMPTFYRHIPRTMQKLWKGEPLHIIVMGSSIDRGSANPPIYPYNEDPTSPDFKKPLCDAYDGKFSAAMVGHPELDKHLANPRHFYSYGGRLKIELMRKFNYPADKILVNFMACDGSCIGESHSGLRSWCELKVAPSPDLNGHKTGSTWQEMYPALFARPEGPRPDLVIYGSGANEKTDTPHEVAVFEGAIRFIQRNYPGTEFLFSVFQNFGGYTPNSGDLQALALRYGIPYLDYGVIGDRICRNANRHAVIDGGHPQAALHYLWFKQIEKAFECADPIEAGIPQQYLPERLHENTLNWEGEMHRYPGDSPRNMGNRCFVLDDAAFNLWGGCDIKTQGNRQGAIFVDGKKLQKYVRDYQWINERNSFFRHGNLKLGDRHIVELVGKNPQITAFDCKVALNRRWHGVESPAWQLPQKATPFVSQTGFPYGKQVITLNPGERAKIKVIGNFFSVAWVDAAKGGELKVLLNGKAKWHVSTAQPFVRQTGEKLFIENRQALPAAAYGIHEIEITANQAPVKLLGLYSYDTRANRQQERIVRGLVTSGEKLKFEPAFKATPIISGVPVQSSSPTEACFSGSGIFEAIGE